MIDRATKALRYQAHLRLNGPQVDTVAALAFSPKGTLLASCSVDGVLCVWSTCSQSVEPLYIVSGAVGFLSLAWLTENDLLFGLEDGTVVSVRITAYDLTATGFSAHLKPLEHIAVSRSSVASETGVKTCSVATGAHNEVKIWKCSNNEQMRFKKKLGPPPTTGLNQHRDILVTSLRWVSKCFETALLVAYMHHGIVLWDTATSQVTHFVPVATSVGGMDVSPDHRFLAVSNMCTGFDIYELRSSAPVTNLHHDIGKSYCIPVVFAHCGEALLGGSPRGAVGLWDVKTGRSLHYLQHQDNELILAIAAHYDVANDRFLVATGTANVLKESYPYVQLWQAEELYTKSLSTGWAATNTRSRRKASSRLCGRVVYIGGVTILGIAAFIAIKLL